MRFALSLALWAWTLLPAADLQAAKAYPAGVYESAGPVRTPTDNVVARTPMIPGQEGVLVRLPWNLCGDDLNCLLNAIQLNLDSAQSLGLKVALMILDGDKAPPAVKSACALFPFSFRGQPGFTMCLAWDANYLSAKQLLVNALGARFDSHPGLGHIYFTGACSTNGAEGHCRVDQAAYTTAGYTPARLTTAYVQILQFYLDAFPTTPITFEAHTIFDRIDLWQAMWGLGEASGRVGVAAWWCSERLSVRGHDTVPVWPLIQRIAASSYAVCQTVSNFSQKPWEFTDFSLVPPLDYGIETDWNQGDVARSFTETLNWVAGLAVHAGQTTPITPFSAIEVWTQDMVNPDMRLRLERYLDSDALYADGFETQ